MVVIAAAAIGAAAVGVYKGGKAAVDHTKKKLGERAFKKTRDQERKDEQMQRELEAVSLNALSFEQRLAKLKNERASLNTKNETKGRFRLGKSWARQNTKSKVSTTSLP